MLLTVDDLHWCDRQSLRFLAYLARRLEGTGVALAGGLRTAEPGTDPVMIGELASALGARACTQACSAKPASRSWFAYG